ncbi:Arc family DNA-binding protein [Marinovum algicola]|uniref:Arc family DNA-binding protein n=1 Tax=Marinovum algicola TaxID=42444 RepID=UPI003B5261AB
MTDRAPQSQDKFIVRLPDGMRDRIKAAAEANNRSMNAEIIARLDASFSAERERDARLDTMESKIDGLRGMMDLLYRQGLLKRDKD